MKLVYAFLVVLFSLGSSLAAGSADVDAQQLLTEMERAYRPVANYRTDLVVITYDERGASERREVVYTFEKPGRTRLDFKGPHSGMVLIYRPTDLKAVIRPSGLLRFLKIRLDPAGPMLRSPSGQRIDQTDLGVLIHNISLSLTEQRRGGLEVASDAKNFIIRVAAVNHFRPDVVTRYTFKVDKETRLPAAVEERSLDGSLERVIVFRNLRVDVPLPEGFFKLD